MKSKHRFKEIALILRLLAGFILPLAWMSLTGSTGWEDWVFRALFVIAVLFLSDVSGTYDLTHNKVNQKGSIFLLAGLAALAIAAVWEQSIPAWMGLIFWFTGCLLLAPTRLTDKTLALQIFDLVLLAALAGGLPALLNQILTHFAEEEFFAILGLLLLSGLWTILWIVRTYILGKLSENIQWAKTPWVTKRFWTRIGLALIGLAGLVLTGRLYQKSFYPPSAPDFPGISTSNPMICGQLPVEPAQKPASLSDVQTKFASTLARKDITETNDLAFITLVNEDLAAAAMYKELLLQEARMGAYTEPAHSVKYDQYLAAQTIYFYLQVRSAFPQLFTSEEIQEIQIWIEDINRRAQTVEWVDWLYALAFSKSPDGAYENQEIGAGLYALLEAHHLSPPELSSQNRAYLEAYPGGWTNAFRVTDDAIAYQPVWINNAFFQSQIGPAAEPENVRLSFDWFLAQSLPDAMPLGYNFPLDISLAPASLFGAIQLEDQNLLWLAERALDTNYYITAQPGAEGNYPYDLVATKPDMGSCLIFGNSGLPGQDGPLAPDKIVFRSGWDADDLYLLVNLRFTGWHRYKATNTIPLIYAGETLIKDSYTTEPISWLPKGRAAVRDKRIPRENLNGLLLPRQGLDAVLHSLLGLGSNWAQDPPYYAEVAAFSTSDDVDIAKTTIQDWHGWQHDRTIFFYREGPVFILDEASGPSLHGPAAIRWNIAAEMTAINANRFQVGSLTNLEMVLLGQSNGHLEYTENLPSPSITYIYPKESNLSLLTILLTDNWRNAQVIRGANQDNLYTVMLSLDGETITYNLDINE